MNEEPVESYSRLARKSQFAGNLAHYRDLLIRRWWVLAIGVVVGIAVEIAVMRFQKPSYLSLGQMIVNVKLSLPQGAMFTEELSNFLGTQAALMQSDVVVNRAFARALSLATNSAGERPLLKVSVSPRTTIFNLQARGTDAKVTQEFLQASMEEYIRLKREMRKQASDSTVAGLSEEVLTLEKELRNAEEQIAEFQGTNSMVWLEEQGNTVGNYLAGLNQRREALKSEYDLLQTLTLDQNVQRQDAGGVVSPDDAGGATNGVVNNNTLASDYLKAKQQVLLMKAEQQDMGQFLRPKHPKMVAMAEDIARRERLLEIYRQQNAEQLEGRKASVALQLQNLEKDIKEWDAKIVEISRKSAQYQRLKTNAQRIQALYQQLVATVQTLDANKEVGAETVSIMEPASPGLLDARRGRNNAVFAALGCLFATVAMLVFLNRLDDRVNSFSDLQDLFDDPVLAQIPREKRGAKDLPLLVENDERHAFVEAYRNLRSSLLYAGQREKQPKTVLLTSSIPNEGKSLTATNLAIALASAGSRVLLVDADLRKGVLHDRLGVEDGPGLSEALTPGGNWKQTVNASRFDNLSLLRRGRPTNRSGELFLRPGLRDFLKEAAEAYDFVLLDTPPVMAADDVTTLAPLVDAVAFVVRAEHTSARVAHAALDLLYQRNAQILGIVFNAVRPGSGDYYYYKYRDYYASYPDHTGGKPASASSAPT